MKPTQEQRQREIDLWQKSLATGKPEQEIIGWTDDDRSVREPIKRMLFQWLHDPEHHKRHPNLTSAEDRRERLVWLADSLKAAEVAHRKNELRQLKKISDEIRNALGEVPETIPPGGFADIDEMTYECRLTPNELKARIVANLEKRGWLEQFLEIRSTNNAK